MSKERLRLLIVGLVVVAGSFAYLWHRLRVDDLKEQLVVEANQVLGVHRVRPSHVEHPTKGDFGEALGQHLPAIEQTWKEFPRDNDARWLVSRIIDGERAVSDAPAAYLKAMEQLRPHLDGALLATHTESAGSAGNSGSVYGSRLVASLAGLRLRQALAAGQTTEALELCLDTLAFARDSIIVGGMNGRDVGSHITRRISLACVAAFQTQRGEELRLVPARLRRIRDAIPRFEVTLREESIQAQLVLYGRLLSPEQLERLQPRPRMLAGQPPTPTSGWKRFVQRAIWRDYREAFAKIIDASMKRPDVRDAAFRVLGDEAIRKPSWMADEIPRPQSYSRFVQRSDVTAVRFDFLLASAAAQVYRAEKGVWPRDLDMLAEGGVLSEAERDRMVEEMISLRLDEKGAVEIKAPQANERGASDLVATLAEP